MKRNKWFTLGRWAVIALVVVLALPLAATASASPASQAGVTATTNVNLKIRSGPGTGFDQVGLAPAGTTVPVLGRNQGMDWLLVQYGDTTGWIAAWFTGISGDLNAVPVAGQDQTVEQPPAAASVDAAPAPTPASNKQVWVFYMGFWAGGMSWDWQANVLTDHPLIGSYDSRDPGAVGTQIEQAQSAGIDAFIVSWFGVGDQATTTPTLNNVLDRAAERGFHAAAAVDIFDPNFNRNRDQMIQSLNYLVHDRANHPGYLRYNGKPVIFFAFQDRTGLSAADWLAIRNQVDPNRDTMWIAEGIGGCCIYNGAMDGMYVFNLAWANGSAARFAREQRSVTSAGGSMYIPTIHPGWNEDLIAARDGRPNPTSPRDRAGGAFLRQSFNGAASTGADVILVVSWNEFMENSHIEPSQVYGTQALDVLRPLIAAWKGQP
jgi:uncharacterized protein YraI